MSAAFGPAHKSIIDWRREPLYRLSVKPEEIGPHANLPFHFEAHRRITHRGRDGEEFADKSAAYARATEVARDIRRNREAKCRAYRLQVCDENLEPCFEILFASIDEALNHLPDDLRHRVEAHATASLNDTVRSGERDVEKRKRDTGW